MAYSGLRLDRTCDACPEQYDVYDGDETERIGYLRLRYGHFRADFYGPGQRRLVVVYEASTQGDGQFAADEREEHLEAACKAIRAALNPPAPDRLERWSERVAMEMYTMAGEAKRRPLSGRVEARREMAAIIRTRLAELRETGGET
jgi:hypothetical protein